MSIDQNIYNVPSSLSELPGPSEVIGISYRKIIPRATATGANFASGSINFSFTLGGNQAFIPNRSFVVMRQTMFENSAVDMTGDAVQPDQTTYVEQVSAPSYLQPQACFDGAQMKVGSYTISSVQNYLPQVAAVEHRLSKSASWMKNSPTSIQYGSPHFDERKAQIGALGVYNQTRSAASRTIQLTGDAVITAAGAITGTGTFFLNELKKGDLFSVTGSGAQFVSFVTDDVTAQCFGVNSDPIAVAASCFKNEVAGTVHQTPTERANKSETAFQPPLGIFKVSKALSGSFELILTPKSNSQFRTSALQSENRLLNASGGLLISPAADISNGDSLAGYNAAFNVDSIAFYVAVVDSASPNAQESSVVLELEDTQVQARRISDGQTTESFQVPRSTFATSWAVQAHNAGSTTLYPPTTFKFGAPSVLAAFGQEQDKLTSYQATYSGQTRSQPADDVKMVDAAAGVDGVDYTTWAYLKNQISCGGQFDSGGPISKETDKALGKLHTLQWRRPAGSLSTDLQLSTTWDAFNGATERPNLLLFTHSRSIVEWKQRDGQIIGFSNQSA